MNDRNRSFASKIETPQDDVEDLLQQYGFVSNTFDHARDPYVSKQLNDKLASNRRSDENGEGSWMISKEQPRSNFEPPEDLRRPELAKTFASRLAEDDSRARARVSDEQLEKIANDFDLDFEQDGFGETQKTSHGHSQS